MMMTRISPREWEALSAYLDNQLGLKDRTTLEARLSADKELRAALNDLRRTRAVLRSQPGLRAPRNFTLTPQMAGVRRRSWSLPVAYPMLRMASALATIFFVLLFIGNLTLRVVAPQSTMIALAPQAEVNYAEPVVGMGGGGGAVVEQALPTLAAEAAPLPEAPAPLEPALAASAPTQDAMMEAARPATASDMPEAKALQVTPLVLEVEGAPTEAQAEENVMKKAGEPALPTTVLPQADGGEGSEAEMRPARVISVAAILGWLQVLLALVAIGAGLAAFYLRRSSHD